MNTFFIEISPATIYFSDNSVNYELYLLQCKLGTICQGANYQLSQTNRDNGKTQSRGITGRQGICNQSELTPTQSRRTAKISSSPSLNLSLSLSISVFSKSDCEQIYTTIIQLDIGKLLNPF